MWSLGYEVPYYVLFGFATFLKGPARIVALLLCGLVAGPQVLFLLPIWWSGIWLYDLWQWFRSPRASASARAALLAGAVAALLFLYLPLGGTTGFQRIASLPNPLALLHQPVVRASMFEYSTGLLSFATLLLLLCSTDLLRLPKHTPAVSTVRFVAESTFTLYLFHFPMLMFAGALHLYSTSLDKVLVMAAIVVFCIAASVPIGRFKRWLRDRFSPRRAS